MAGLIFLALTLLRRRRLQVRLADLPKLVALGVVAFGLDGLATLYGLKLGGVLSFALASSLNAVITASVTIAVLRERVGRRFGWAVALSVAGGLLLAWGKASATSLGTAAASLGLIWAAYGVEALAFAHSRRYKERLPLTEYLAILQLSAAAFLWILCAVTGRLPEAMPSLPPPAWAALAFVCLVSCCLCYLLLYWLLNHLAGHKLAFFDCFHTGAAALTGVLLFDDAWNAAMVVGGVLLVGAVLVVALGNVERGGFAAGRGSFDHLWRRLFLPISARRY